MNIYYIESGGPDVKGFPFSNSIGRLPSRPPFFDEIEWLRIQAWWKVNPRENLPGIYTDNDRGTKWGDILRCSTGYVQLLLSERVLSGLRSLGSDIWKATELPVVHIGTKKMRSIPPPRYFVVQASSGIERDWAASGIPFDTEGKPIIDPLNLKPAIAKLSTWNGQDIFSWSNMGNKLGLTLLCTERVVELAEKEKWTNVRFDPVATS